MAIPYERAVAEDLNIGGGGTASVTMPGGGSATGHKIGLHSFFGATYDPEDLAATITAIGSDVTTLVITSNVSVTSNVTIPVNVSLAVFAPGKFTISSGVTLTVAGAVQAGRHQIFAGAGSVNLTDAKLDWVYPEWWGAVALKAASGTPTDSTTAIEAAIDSKRNVLFDQGIYGTTGGHVIETDGQILRGQGISVPADGQGGTILYKLSGTTRLMRGGSFIGCELSDLILDGNDLGGELLRWQSINSRVQNVRFRNQGGTDYALYLYATNLSSFRDLVFSDGNYGHIITENGGGGADALYASFFNLSMGSVDGGYGIYLRKAIGFSFFGVEGDDAQILIEDNCQACRFYGLKMEQDGNTTVLPIHVNGSSVLNTAFHGVRIARASASLLAEVKITSAIGTSITDLYYTDLVSAANKPGIQLDGAISTNLRNIEAYTQNTCDLIDCTGTRSDNTVAEQIHTHSGAAGRCDWKVSNLSVNTSNCDQVFQATSEKIAFVGVTGTITRTNGARFESMTSGAEPAVTFTDQDTTPDVGGSSFFIAANTVATTITAFDNTTGNERGDRITVRFDNGNTTLDFSSNANLKGNNGSDWTAASGDWLNAVYDGSAWLCTVNQG
jgi:hypothetical protein